MVMARPAIGWSGVSGPERCEFDERISGPAMTVMTVTATSAAAKMTELRRLAV